jgi:hypothetical protein
MKTFIALARYQHGVRLQPEKRIDFPQQTSQNLIMRVKTLMLFSACLCALCVMAQVVSDFRIFDGKLYNVQKSTLWETIPPDTILRRYVAKVDNVRSNRVLVRIEYLGDNYIANDVWDGRLVMILNHPKQDTLARGDIVPKERLFPVGNRQVTNSAGVAFPVKAYDYGLLNTPENRKTLK